MDLEREIEEMFAFADTDDKELAESGLDAIFAKLESLGRPDAPDLEIGI